MREIRTVQRGSCWRTCREDAEDELPPRERHRLRGPAGPAAGAAGAGALPGHHHDPFDRMLVAQAQIEGLTLVAHDDVFGDYGVTLLKV